MSLPYFYVTDLSADTITLEEDTSKHVIQVLRMKVDEQLLLTDGKGTKAVATILDDNRKRCTVKLSNVTQEPKRTTNVSIGISLVKNASRFEWFLEKATEIGVTEIIPLICDRTEKEKFRHDRLQSILISAMLQSQQCWLPVLHEPVAVDRLIKETNAQNKFIAHCLPNEKRQLASELIHHSPLTTHESALITHHASLILIGPEGDFTEKEIASALEQGFEPVALGNTRLRTETAGMVAATLLCQLSQ
ncbi:MAG TPA: RsmE family RNA methyltransferase [Flavisolibacter sp.]|nr:RsmE family RNA methyltransferase [Flavisolibacter sp.]